MMKFKFSKRKKTDAEIRNVEIDRKNIISHETVFTTTEEYKALRTNVMFALPHNGCKVIGMASANMAEGKSINCLNLAITFAQTSAKVLLLDCDLRLPRCSRLLNIKSTPGVSNILVGMNSIEDSIQTIEKHGIDVLMSGDIPPNPSELLGSERMGELLESLKTRYDYIFIDLPPIGVVSDALAISKYLSGIILVVRSAKTKKDEVAEMLNRLAFVETNVLGMILNDVLPEGNKRKSYRKNYGYDYSPKEKTVSKKTVAKKTVQPRSQVGKYVKTGD
jgi:capsular exopolysaccharide synthesis family protein